MESIQLVYKDDTVSVCDLTALLTYLQNTPGVGFGLDVNIFMEIDNWDGIKVIAIDLEKIICLLRSQITVPKICKLCAK